MGTRRALDLVSSPWQLPVKDKDTLTPPGSPVKGDRYIVGGTGTGAWSGWDQDIVYYDGSAWQHDTPSTGWYCQVEDENKLYYFNGATWVIAFIVGPASAVNENLPAFDGTTGKLIKDSGKGLTFLVPSGGIIMWSGSIATIPSGYVLCNGANGTPDLRDKFIVGAKQDDSGVAKTNITGSLTQAGGAVSHSHGAGTYAGPSHYHSGPSHRHTGPSHYHTINNPNDMYAGTYSVSRAGTTGWGGTGNTSYAGTNNTGWAGTGAVTGSSASVNHLPNYYALAFIMKT